MSEEKKDAQTQQNNAPKKVVKKKVVSSFSNGGGSNPSYGYGASYGYGYGYGNYNGYGNYGSYGNYGTYGNPYGKNYGAAPQGNEIPNRTFADYLQILREKIWFIVITFLIILSRQHSLYFQSHARLHFARHNQNPKKRR